MQVTSAGTRPANIQTEYKVIEYIYWKLFGFFLKTVMKVSCLKIKSMFWVQMGSDVTEYVWIKGVLHTSAMLRLSNRSSPWIRRLGSVRPFLY